MCKVILKYVTNSKNIKHETNKQTNTVFLLDRTIKDAFEIYIQRKSLLKDFSFSFKLYESLRHPPEIHNVILHWLSCLSLYNILYTIMFLLWIIISSRSLVHKSNLLGEKKKNLTKINLHNYCIQIGLVYS